MLLFNLSDLAHKEECTPMGGINHQPCRAYLPNSTAMSRALTMSIVGFNLANAALEDVILGELGEKHEADPMTIMSHLDNSKNELSKMKMTVEDLRKQMSDLNFVDVPTLATTDLRRLGLQFHAGGLHVPNSDWAIAATTMEHRGFAGMLDMFDQRIDEIDDMTSKLSSKIYAWIEQTPAGQRYLALEDNEPTNFKVEFAQLYTAWASFQQFFLASSLISTELWYRHNDLGSLVNQPTPLEIAA